MTGSRFDSAFGGMASALTGQAAAHLPQPLHFSATISAWYDDETTLFS
jgi:hypothetical protein